MSIVNPSPSMLLENIRIIRDMMSKRKRVCARRLAAAKRITDEWTRKAEIALNEAEKRYVHDTLAVTNELLAAAPV